VPLSVPSGLRPWSLGVTQRAARKSSDLPLRPKSERSPGLLSFSNYTIERGASGRSSAWFASWSARRFIARGIDWISKVSNRRRSSRMRAKKGCNRGFRTLYRYSSCRTTSSESILRRTHPAPRATAASNPAMAAWYSASLFVALPILLETV
jgi:hypothetical protein